MCKLSLICEGLIHRCRNVWTSLRLKLWKKTIIDSSLHPKRHFWVLDSSLPFLLDICSPPLIDRSQHRRQCPLRFCSFHRPHWSHKTRHSRDVIVLLLLLWHCFTLWHCLHLPILAQTLYCLFNSLLLLPPTCCPLPLRLPTVVSRQREARQGHESSNCYSKLQQKAHSQRSHPLTRHKKQSNN